MNKKPDANFSATWTVIDLSNICLWSVEGSGDTVMLKRILGVLRYCDSLATWHPEKVLFTVTDPAESGVAVNGLRVIQIPKLEWTPWEILIGRTIPVILENYEFSIAVHEDGFPLDMAMWDESFMGYDYIGAPWDFNGLVGSGGFAMTSGLFSKSVSRLPWYSGGVNVDEWLCRDSRDELIKLGVRFAPPEVAIKYCTETTDNESPSFGFHGRRHAVEKYRRGWQQIEAWENENGLE